MPGWAGSSIETSVVVGSSRSGAGGLAPAIVLKPTPMAEPMALAVPRGGRVPLAGRLPAKRTVVVACATLSSPTGASRSTSLPGTML